MIKIPQIDVASFENIRGNAVRSVFLKSIKRADMVSSFATIPWKMGRSLLYQYYVRGYRPLVFYKGRYEGDSQ